MLSCQVLITNNFLFFFFIFGYKFYYQSENVIKINDKLDNHVQYAVTLDIVVSYIIDSTLDEKAQTTF